MPMMMRRDEVLKTLDAHRPEMQERFGVSSLAIFGSIARDQAHAASDLDVLVEFAPEPTFERFMGLKFFLEDLLGLRVDLATPASLRPRLRPIIEREAIRVA